jgi:hypothetical protein
MKRLVLLIAVAGIVCVAGCGGDSSSDGDASGASGPAIAYPEGPTREFFIPGGNNLIQLYGREGTPAEREEASAVVEAWMQARASGDWAEACRHLNAVTKRKAPIYASELSQRKVEGCPAGLRSMASEQPAATQANTMTGPIDSLRVGEGQAYAQYHGRQGKDWIVTLEREGGEWKIPALEPLEREE